MIERLTPAIDVQEQDVGDILFRLDKISRADNSWVEEREQLSQFINQHAVHDTFVAAISNLGEQVDVVGAFARARTESGHLLSASYERPPLLNGGSFIHAYARKYAFPEFGMLLPFDEAGQLDLTREATVNAYFTDGTYVLHPFSSSLREAQATHAIAEVTQMVAARLGLHLAEDKVQLAWLEKIKDAAKWQIKFSLLPASPSLSKMRNLKR